MRRWAWVTLVGVAALLFLALFILANLIHSLELTNEVSLPLLAIAGVVVLLGALALVSIAFKIMDMADPQEALALPAGSIRAVIALSLVVLFAILTVFLFSSLSNGGAVHTLTCLTPSQKDTFEHNLGSQVLLSVESAVSDKEKPCSALAAGASETTKKGGEGTSAGAPGPVSAPSAAPPPVSPPTSGGGPRSDATGPLGAPPGGAQNAPPLTTPAPEAAGAKAAPFFTVHYRDARDPASSDFAKQLLVLIGTLVTAVSSFYFGAKAVSDGQAAASPNPPPKPVGVNPGSLKQGEAGTLHITGSDLNSVARAKLVRGNNQIDDKGVVSNPTEVQAKIEIPDNAEIGKWDVVVIDAAGRAARLQQAFEVTAKA